MRGPPSETESKQALTGSSTIVAPRTYVCVYIYIYTRVEPVPGQAQGIVESGVEVEVIVLWT